MSNITPTLYNGDDNVIDGAYSTYALSDEQAESESKRLHLFNRLLDFINAQHKAATGKVLVDVNEEDYCDIPENIVIFDLIDKLVAQSM